MVALDLDFADLPERVQRVVNGVGTGGAFCGHCRREGASLRCSRCKVVKYCSIECQKIHFAFHKKNCKSISKERSVVEKLWAADLDFSQCTAVKTIDFADLLIQIGYRESDTIRHGSAYYREALKYLLAPKKISDDLYHQQLPYVEDRLLLMLVVLGGDDGAISEWCMETCSNRFHNYMPARDYDWREYEDNVESDDVNIPDFYLMGYAKNDFSYQAILLLALMKLMAAYRHDLKGLGIYKKTMQNAATALGYSISLEDIFDHVSLYVMGETHNGKIELETLPERISELLSAIRYHKNENCLIHLRDSIPFTRDHAPELFDGEQNAVPSELWMIYQDCFFETPGLNDVLHEFLPEEN